MDNFNFVEWGEDLIIDCPQVPEINREREGQIGSRNQKEIDKQIDSNGIINPIANQPVFKLP